MVTRGHGRIIGLVGVALAITACNNASGALRLTDSEWLLTQHHSSRVPE